MKKSKKSIWFDDFGSVEMWWAVPAWVTAIFSVVLILSAIIIPWAVAIGQVQSRAADAWANGTPTPTAKEKR